MCDTLAMHRMGEGLLCEEVLEWRVEVTVSMVNNKMVSIRYYVTFMNQNYMVQF